MGMSLTRATCDGIMVTNKCIDLVWQHHFAYRLWENNKHYDSLHYLWNRPTNGDTVLYSVDLLSVCQSPVLREDWTAGLGTVFPT